MFEHEFYARSLVGGQNFEPLLALAEIGEGRGKGRALSGGLPHRLGKLRGMGGAERNERSFDRELARDRDTHRAMWIQKIAARIVDGADHIPSLGFVRAAGVEDFA